MKSPTSSRLVRRVAMRPRRLIVKFHRWLSLVLLAWFFVIGVTGAWLAIHDSVESSLHSDRYATTAGDVGPDAALAAATERVPEGASLYGLTLPSNGRGVYQVYAEIESGPEDALRYRYLTVFVDPGSGAVNGVTDDEEGATHWLYRGHEYLWQDHGLFGVFDGGDGWCRLDAGGAEPGGLKGVVCDVIPDGPDMVGWFAVGFIAVLLSGFYLWYWPGVRRWATALVVRRGRGTFTFNMSLHKVIGLVVWLPLTVIAFTGAAFAFPNMEKWFDNVTPAHRDFYLWTTPEDLVSSESNGREAIGLDRAREILEERYPSRKIASLFTPFDETGTYFAWVTRGFDPWTREGGAGNAYVGLDQYTGETLYDGIPGEGNVFDQAWDDWSFPLHTGDFGGTTTRVIWVAIGLSPIALGVTGVTMNLVRRSKRKRRSGPTDASGVGGTVAEAVDLEGDLVVVAPEPVLAGLVALDDGVGGGAEVSGGVPHG